MKRYIHTEEVEQLDDIFCMTSVRGTKMENPGKRPFSFYFSGRNSSHGPRVKVTFNPNRLIMNKVGTLELNSDWEFTPGEDDQHVSEKQVDEMKRFFRDYLVLFLLVWDFHLSDPILGDYFSGDADLHDVIQDLDFYKDYRNELDEIRDVSVLEDFCKKNNLVNMYDN